jgi:hypothetical protein
VLSLLARLKATSLGDGPKTSAAHHAVSGRLLPERTIRRDHATQNEITRHRITSFRLVEHKAYDGVSPSDWQGLEACGPKVRSGFGMTTCAKIKLTARRMNPITRVVL